MWLLERQDGVATALDEQSATDLAVLAGAGDDEIVEIGWLTAAYRLKSRPSS
jgi:hypothetical protein